MPLYYDLTRSVTSTASEATHYRILTTTQQETLRLVGLYGGMRSGAAGGGQLRLYTNTGTAASGGTAQTPAPRNLRLTAAQFQAFNDATAITPGTTLTNRVTVGLAQTGGMGGWVALEPMAAVSMMPNATNPVNAEVKSIANGTGINLDVTIEASEG
jgi:hypothetical protein